MTDNKPTAGEQGWSFRLGPDEAGRVVRALREYEVAHPGEPVPVGDVIRKITGREPTRSDVLPPKVDPAAVGPSWEVGPFKMGLMPSAQLAGLEFTADDGRVQVAVLTLRELAALGPLFEQFTEQVARVGSRHVDVAAACRDLIGRDPFENAG
ncbi:hypothetical protein [Micromonospora sp. NBRC 101691]|uniref:hypothetical protein n=1 Tax=Micromonospora sp. NBRC 101691 TaxID=3032198 RepID=UPI0024A5F28F|nr:hypothetical protein [Micromonospora sp. NBRC 101691]GLY25926.1 hypothetical protein Misp04_56570 [Micromonospora sp. NBRC 101691]